MSFARSLAYLVAYSARRQFRSKKMLLSSILLALLAGIVLLVGFQEPWKTKAFGEYIVLGVLGAFFLPMVTLLFGTGALGDDWEEKSLVYLLTRPIPRWCIFSCKFLAAAPWALATTVGALFLLERIAFLQAHESFISLFGFCFRAILLGTLAYTALFTLLGAVFRHSTLIAIGYVFIIEVFLGSVPGILKRLSIRFHVWSMIYDGGPLHPEKEMFFLPVSGETASWVLTSVAVGCVIIGAFLFSRREYRDTI